jgi:hypothetical protein
MSTALPNILAAAGGTFIGSRVAGAANRKNQVQYETQSFNQRMRDAEKYGIHPLQAIGSAGTLQGTGGTSMSSMIENERQSRSFKKARYRDEGNRQRRDTKARRYKQLLRFVNRTYGRYDDVRDVAEAWKYSSNLSDFVEALAINEAIDFTYGKRSQLINKHINQPLRLPVGALALRSLWRHGTSPRSHGSQI